MSVWRIRRGLGRGVTVVLCRLGHLGGDRDGITLRLESVLVGHPVDGDGLAVGGLEAV